MGWFSGLGHDLSKAVGKVDRAISGNNITSKILDPMRAPSQRLTSSIFGRGTLPTNLYGKITNHPVESAAAAAAAYYGGEYAFGGGGTAAGLGEGAAGAGTAEPALGRCVRAAYG